MKIEDIPVGSCIIINNDGIETVLGMVETVSKPRNEVKIRVVS